SQHFPMHFGSYKTTPPSLPSLQSLSISVPTSHNPADSGHAADSRHRADSGAKPSNLAATTQLWMEFKNTAETTSPSSRLPSNLAATTQMWMEMEDNAEVTESPPSPPSLQSLFISAPTAHNPANSGHDADSRHGADFGHAADSS